jgi:hypothetical protein
MNLYGYVGGNPINAWDPLGLEVRCYAAPAFIDLDTGAYHLFFYSDVPGVGGVGTGMNSSGGRRGSGVPSGFDPKNTRYPSTPVTLPKGMTDKQFIDAVRNSEDLNSGVYTPGMNDCHSQAKKTAKKSGASYKRPKKRFHLGEFIINWTDWMTAIR